MTAAQIVTIITALASLVTAVTALVKVLRHLSAHQQPVSLPHADTERAEPRDTPMGFAPPEAKL